MSSVSRLRLPIVPAAPPPAAPSTEASASAENELVDDEAGLLQVGDLAKAVGKTVRAIHLYEELGLLRPSARSKGRYRLFDHDALVRVRWIGKLQDLGLTLSEIQCVVRAWEEAPSAPGAMGLMRDTYRTRLAETRAQIARLRALEVELAASLHYLETCDSCDPARLVNACVACDQHTCEHQAPELVAGLHASKKPSSTKPPVASPGAT